MAQYLTDQKYNENLWTRMAEENPEIFLYIHKMSKTIEGLHGRDAAKGVENCAGILYRLLENQADADELAELLG